MPVRERCDKRLRLCHIHVQGRIAYISSTVKDECALHDIPVSQFHACIGKSIHLLELRELHLAASTLFIVVGMTIKEACISIETRCGHSPIRTIHLQVSIRLITRIRIQMEQVSVETHPTQLQV